MKWFIEYTNDVNFDVFQEWWEVSDGERVFKCDNEKDARWLLDILNSQ